MINRQLKQSKEDLAKEDYRQECGRNVWRSGSLRAEEICPDHGSPRPGQAFGDPGDPAGAHPKRRGLPRRRALVAAAFVPAALGLLALILTVGAVQTVGAAILPGCLGFRAAVLKVRIHLPPAGSPQTFGSWSRRPAAGSALALRRQLAPTPPPTAMLPAPPQK